MGKEFSRELQDILNAHGIDNALNTPDFIIAEYLMGCLASFRRLKDESERWFGRGLRIGGETREGLSREYDGGLEVVLYDIAKKGFDDTFRDQKTPDPQS